MGCVERAVDKEWTQDAWRGSPAGLADLLEEVQRLVNQANAKEENAQARAHISVKHGDGDGDLLFDTVAEFGAFARGSGAKLAGVRRLYAAIGEHVGDVGVTLVAGRHRLVLLPALDVTVRGRNPVAVNGVAEEVKTFAQRGGQRVRTWAAYGIPWLIGMILAIVAIPLSGPAEDPIWLAGSALSTGAVVFGLLAPFVRPQFEVLDPEAPRSGAARVRDALASSGRWLLAALAGAAIYAVVQKLIDNA